MMSVFTYYKVGELNANSQEITERNLYKIELLEELAKMSQEFRSVVGVFQV